MYIKRIKTKRKKTKLTSTKKCNNNKRKFIILTTKELLKGITKIIVNSPVSQLLTHFLMNPM